MKAHTYRHPKLLRLARRLKLEPWAALGVVEALTEWAKDFAPDGGLGRFQPADVAEGIGWRRNADELVAALQAEGWLDDDGSQLLIHDWHQHADDAVQRSLARAGRLFANGERPSLVRLTKLERERSLPLLEAAEVSYRAHRAPNGRPPGALAGAPARPGPARPGPTRKEKILSSPNGDERQEGFARFWERYPNHHAKHEAEKAWRKLQPDAALEARIHQALDWQLKDTEWTKEGGQFVPYAQKYLNKRRWEDEPPAMPPEPPDGLAAYIAERRAKGVL